MPKSACGLLLALVVSLAASGAAVSPAPATPPAASGAALETDAAGRPHGAAATADTDAASRPPAAGATPVLRLNVRDATLLSLSHNKDLAVQHENPAIQRTFEAQQRAVFDPVLSGAASYSRQRRPRTDTDSTGMVAEVSEGGVALDEKLPTGTGLTVEAGTDRSRGAPRPASTRVGLTVTQSLLRGFGAGVNLATLRQARLETQASEYELRGFAEALVGRVETTYWDYVLARQKITLVEDSRKLAEKQLAETNERVRIGKLAKIELAAAGAEVAQRQEDLINARSTLARTRLALLRLLNPPGEDLWNRELELTETPTRPEETLDAVTTHVALALRMRPDLNQARLDLQRNELEIVKTRNGLLPRMDLFVTLGKSGYADTFSNSVRGLDGDNYDAAVGVSLEYPLGNRDARARHQRASLSRQQAAEAVENLAQLVELDVRTAYIEVDRAREQAAATTATRSLKEEALRAETEKFRVGKSTTFLVAQAQRDLLVSQLGELQAQIYFHQALVDFYRLEGTLLARRGLEAPGAEPPAP